MFVDLQIAIAANNIEHVSAECIRILPTWFGYKDRIEELTNEFAETDCVTSCQTTLRRLVQSADRHLSQSIVPILESFIAPVCECVCHKK